jgi:hypothetical protein
MFVYGYVPAHRRGPRPQPPTAILRDVADRIEATPLGRTVSGRRGAGGLIGVYVLVDDDEAWQQIVRARIDAERD